LRKLLAIALLAIFGFSVVSPLLASTGAETTLPACCRKAAGHHCTAMQHDASTGTTHAEFRAHMDHCPCCGVLGSATAHLDVLSFTTFAYSVTPRSTRSGLHPQTSMFLLANLSAGNDLRGPPVSITA
jgi:hypothetical protein